MNDDDPPARFMILECKHGCSPLEPILCWRELSDGRQQLGANCRDCGRWIKWVPQDEEWLTLAAQQGAGMQPYLP